MVSSVVLRFLHAAGEERAGASLCRGSQQLLFNSGELVWEGRLVDC